MSFLRTRVFSAIVALLVLTAGLAFARLAMKDGGSGPLVLENAQIIPTEEPALGSLITWDHYLAWVSIPEPSGKGGEVVVYDLERKETKIIANDLYTGGISWVRGSKNTVVYLSFDYLPCDEDTEKERPASGCSQMPRAWKVVAHDLANGERDELAQSTTDAEKPSPPFPEISWPYVVWSVPPAEASTSPTARGIALHDLEDRRTTVLVSGTIVGRTTIEKDTVLYTAAVPGEGLWDLFSISAGKKSIPRRLSTSGKVGFPRASDGLVAWQEPSDAEPDQAPDFSVWAQSLKGASQPVRVAESGSNPVPANGFVLWLGSPTEGGQLLAKDPYSKTDPIVVEQQPDFGAGWWAFGDRVVWATVRQESEGPRSIIHVARVMTR